MRSNLLAEFERTTDDFFSLEELRKKIEKKQQLVIKYGVDLTAPFLHLGHAVNLWMMRLLQEEGHKVIFLLGDFTTMIGDPTGRSEARQMLSPEEIENNANDFISQVSSILITDDPNVFEIRRNSEWFSKMPLGDFISLLTMVTHARLISRDMFQSRISKGQEIHMSEMLYPILQGYDSYMLKSDITIVGSDQLFNEMMGRHFQSKYGQDPQVIITTRITHGLCGKFKQSKSLGNYIAIIDSPKDKFGKAMSLSDDVIIEWMEVYTDISIDEISHYSKQLKDVSVNPRDIKICLAKALVKRYHGKEESDIQEQLFLRTFAKKEFPENAPIRRIDETPINIVDMLHHLLPNETKSHLRRLILQGAIKLNDEKVEDINQVITLEPNGTLQTQVGKRHFFKVIASV